MKLYEVCGTATSVLIRTPALSAKTDCVSEENAVQLRHDKAEKFLVRGGAFRLLVPAFSPELAERKARLQWSGICWHTWRPTAAEILKGAKPEPSARLEVAEIHHSAEPRRRWDEKRGRYSYPRPTYDGRRLAREVSRTAPVAYGVGLADARRLFSPKKKAISSLRASRAYKLTDEREAYERGFLAQWSRLAANPPATPKRRRKLAK